MQKSKKLSIRYGWSPLGESMPSVLHKVQHLNRIKASQLRSIFAKKHNLWISGPSSTALRPEYFEFDQIIASTGWTREEISASFPEYLLGFSDHLINRRSQNGISLNESLRVCKSCFSAGCHLLLHQLDEWSLCPIHRCPLTTLCPKCSNTLGEYKIDLDLDTAFKCQSCEYRLVNERFEYDPKLVKKKHELLSEYSQWCQDTNHVLSGVNRDKYLFVSQPEHYSQISAYYKLLGGPSWFNQCLRDCAEGLKYHRRNYKLKSPLPQPNICERGDLFYAEDSCKKKLNVRRCEFEEGLRKRLLVDFCAVDKEIRSTFQWISEDSTTPDRMSRGYLSFSENGGQGATQALELLTDEIFNQLANPDEPFYPSLFWGHWEYGPGSLLKLKQQKNGNVTAINGKWVKEISSVWFRAILKSIYKNLLLQSFIFDSGDPKLFETGRLLEIALQPLIFGSGSIYAATQNNLIELSSIASLKRFGSVLSEEHDSCRHKPNKKFGHELFNLVACHKNHRMALENTYYLIAKKNQNFKNEVRDALRNALPR